MKYFKNTELAKLYNVSEKSVRNWIQAAKEGKLELTLHTDNGKATIANTTRNTTLIEELVQKGKKYKNTRGYKVIRPSEKFYKTFSRAQILDLISNLTVHHELPLKYSYVDGGANYWDEYAQRLMSEDTPNMLTRTVDLLSSNLSDIDKLLRNYNRINIIDLGPGNSLPVRELIGHLLSQKKLHRYIALDISKEMLDIAEKNVHNWHGSDVPFESHIHDLDHSRFDNIIAEDESVSDGDFPINLVLLLGGTLCNLRRPDQALQAIYDSMGPDDLFIYSTKLDSPRSRRYFDFSASQQVNKLTPRHKLILDMLNVDEALYEAEQFFDTERQARFIKITFKVAVSMVFDSLPGTRQVHLNKGDTILVWRYWHQDAIQIINQSDKNGFSFVRAVTSEDQEYLLLTSKIKTAES